MLFLVEKGIRGGICHAIHRYVKSNNKYIKKYDKNKESSYIQCLDANNLHAWVMSQILPVDNYKWVQYIPSFNEKFMNIFDEESDEKYILEVDMEYLKDLHNFRSDLPFLPERIKINKFKKLECNLYDKILLLT